MIAGSFLLFSCGGESNEESNDSHSTEVTEEVEVTEEAPATIAEDLDVATFNSYLAEKSGLLIDVRTADEYAGGSIDGAINLDWTNGDFEAAVDTLDKSKPTFVFCQAGGRSGQAKSHLMDQGFTEVYNLIGGYSGWSK
ncbi:MAG: rhodanese-like domain-containing protein [Crocinitomicaceae bacterium]|nr:rhodanese-like domain-containing protein [Crocinitomicaceae bacterium]